MKADLNYLTWVINEAMRLHPVFAGGIVRETGADMEHEGMRIPKGSTALVHFYTLFRSHISQPDEFLPDRWDETHPEYALLKSLFMPFSLGKRNCMGMYLALLEIRCAFLPTFLSIQSSTLLLTHSMYPFPSLCFLQNCVVFHLSIPYLFFGQQR